MDAHIASELRKNHQNTGIRKGFTMCNPPFLKVTTASMPEAFVVAYHHREILYHAASKGETSRLPADDPAEHGMSNSASH